jgi:hypothetical protein
MEAITSLLAVITGLLLRLALPIVGTAILIYLLRKLDAHWQTQAQLTPIPMEKVECWKVKGCSLEQQKNCLAASSALPCWQVQRLPNGYLREKCISCEVFTNAASPTLKIEPRRM